MEMRLAKENRSTGWREERGKEGMRGSDGERGKYKHRIIEGKNAELL